MTAAQRRALIYLITVAVTSAVYFVLIGRRLLDQPVADISWVRPMIWTMVASFAGSTVLGVVACGRPDVRDREIGWIGNRATFIALAVGTLGALILSMAGAETFWIGNLLFLCATLGAIAETVTKLHLYRR